MAVKRGIGRNAARNVAPQRARELIEAAARESLRSPDAVQPYDPGRPSEIAVEFMSPSEVAKYRGRRGVEITGPESAVSRAEDWWTAWRQLFLEPRLAS